MDNHMDYVRGVTRGGKPGLLKEINKILILELLRSEGPLSRAQLTRRLDLSFPCVSANVKSLLQANIITEVGSGENVLGRKSTLLKYNDTRGYVLGVNLGRSKTSTLVADLSGHPLGRYTTRPYSGLSAKQLMGEVTAAVDTLLEEVSLRKGDLLCAAMGIPGIIDARCGTVRLAPFVDGWEEVDPAETMRQALGMPVLIENNINMGAIGEKWRGAAQGYNNILYMDIGVGIGSAAILNNELYYGTNGAAGEIGYSVANAGRMRKKYSDEGLLEQMIGEECARVPGTDGSMQKLFQLCEEGGRAARRAVGRILRYYASAMNNSICVVDPEIVIVSGGTGGKLMESYREELLEIIGAHVPYLPRVTASLLGKDANLFGAISLALQEVYKTVM